MARAKTFDQKFGKQFLKSLPGAPGVYRIFDAEGTLIYVGKAKNLRRRLGQYRHAKRCKKHEKMRTIIRNAGELRYEVCATELDALLLETRLIQENRPRFNVAGAFSFLYPMIGMRIANGNFSFCYTHSPDECAAYELHGAYRSRYWTGKAFFALMKLLEYVGHRIPKKARLPDSRSYVFSFRRISEDWLALWRAFWMGESKKALEVLALALLENAGARKASGEVEELLKQIARFWKHEAAPLHRARRSAGFATYPVPQPERDILFLKHRHAPSLPQHPLVTGSTP